MTAFILRAARYPWFQIALSCLLVILIQVSTGPKFFDDAYITFRYARNLSLGYGFVYNPSQQVLGATTPLYTLLLAVSAWLAGPHQIPTAAFILTIIFDSLNIWLLFRLSSHLFKDTVIALSIAFAFLLHPLRLDVAAGGMETSLFIFCLLAMYDCYLLGSRSWQTGLWAGLAFLIRPDAVLAIAPVFIDWFFRDRKKSIQAAAILIAIVLPWTLWAATYFGSPIPQSIIAKGASSHTLPAQALYFLLTFFATGTVGPYPHLPIFLFGLPVIACLIYLVWKALIPAYPSVWVIVAYPFLYLIVMAAINPPLHFAWYYPPLMPGLLIIFLGAFSILLKFSPSQKRWVIASAGLLLLGISTLWMTLYPNWPLDRARELAFWDACAAIQIQVRSGEVVLAPDIGILGWCLDRARIFDSVGLISPEAALYDQTISQRMLSEVNPAYIIALDQFIDPALRDRPWFTAAFTQLWAQPVTITGITQNLHIFGRTAAGTSLQP